MEVPSVRMLNRLRRAARNHNKRRKLKLVSPTGSSRKAVGAYILGVTGLRGYGVKLNSFDALLIKLADCPAFVLSK